MVKLKYTSTSISTTISSSSKRNLLPHVYKDCKYVLIKIDNLKSIPQISLTKKVNKSSTSNRVQTRLVARQKEDIIKEKKSRQSHDQNQAKKHKKFNNFSDLLTNISNLFENLVDEYKKINSTKKMIYKKN